MAENNTSNAGEPTAKQRQQAYVASLVADVAAQRMSGKMSDFEFLSGLTRFSSLPASSSDARQFEVAKWFTGNHERKVPHHASGETLAQKTSAGELGERRLLVAERTSGKFWLLHRHAHSSDQALRDLTRFEEPVGNLGELFPPAETPAGRAMRFRHQQATGYEWFESRDFSRYARYQDYLNLLAAHANRQLLDMDSKMESAGSIRDYLTKKRGFSLDDAAPSKACFGANTDSTSLLLAAEELGITQGHLQLYGYLSGGRGNLNSDASVYGHMKKVNMNLDLEFTDPAAFEEKFVEIANSKERKGYSRSAQRMGELVIPSFDSYGQVTSVTTRILELPSIHTWESAPKGLSGKDLARYHEEERATATEIFAKRTRSNPEDLGFESRSVRMQTDEIDEERSSKTNKVYKWGWVNCTVAVDKGVPRYKKLPNPLEGDDYPKLRSLFVDGYNHLNPNLSTGTIVFGEGELKARAAEKLGADAALATSGATGMNQTQANLVMQRMSDRVHLMVVPDADGRNGAGIADSFAAHFTPHHKHTYLIDNSPEAVAEHMQSVAGRLKDCSAYADLDLADSKDLDGLMAKVKAGVLEKDIRSAMEARGLSPDAKTEEAILTAAALRKDEQLVEAASAKADKINAALFTELRDNAADAHAPLVAVVNKINDPHAHGYLAASFLQTVKWQFHRAGDDNALTEAFNRFANAGQIVSSLELPSDFRPSELLAHVQSLRECAALSSSLLPDMNPNIVAHTAKVLEHTKHYVETPADLPYMTSEENHRPTDYKLQDMPAAFTDLVGCNVGLNEAMGVNLKRAEVLPDPELQMPPPDPVSFF